jgi:hypothetical protein
VDSQPVNVFNNAGIESHPFPGDFALTVPVTSTGEHAAVGFISPNNEITAQGDTVLYSRSDATTVAARVAARSNGSVTIANGVGQITLLSNGTIDLNGVQVAPDGTITTAAGLQLDVHRHALVGGGETLDNV